MQNYKSLIWCAALLALSACDSDPGGDPPPMDEPDAATMDLDGGAPDGAAPPAGEGGVELGGCEAGQPCRCPMATRGGTPYILCPDAVNHAEAVAACASAGMQLITIESAEEQDWVWATSDDMFVSGAKDVWIGLGDADSEGDHVWPDGTPLDGYTNWADNQPDNGGTGADAVDEDCVELGQFNDGKWNDQDCSLEYLGFICEG